MTTSSDKLPQPEEQTDSVDDGSQKRSRSSSSITTKASPWSVAETLDRLLAILETKGIKLFDVIDHSGEAAKAGLKLRDTKVVIFGNPVAGTAVMDASPLAALDLPLKVLVWADGQDTRLSNLAPAAFGERFALSEDLVARVSVIDSLIDAVIGS